MYCRAEVIKVAMIYAYILQLCSDFYSGEGQSSGKDQSFMIILE